VTVVIVPGDRDLCGKTEWWGIWHNHFSLVVTVVFDRFPARHRRSNASFWWCSPCVLAYVFQSAMEVASGRNAEAAKGAWLHVRTRCRCVHAIATRAATVRRTDPYGTTADASLLTNAEVRIPYNGGEGAPKQGNSPRGNFRVSRKLGPELDRLELLNESNSNPPVRQCSNVTSVDF